MKTSMRERFKNNFKFVKPLYRKAKYQNKGERTGIVPISFDRTVKLDGQDFDVKTIIKGNVNSEINNERKVVLPGTCDSDNDNVDHEAKLNKLYNKILNEKCASKDTLQNNFIVMIGQSRSESNNTYNRVNSTLHIFPQVPDTWLRICPAPKVPGESICSILIRCLLCQVGLATFLTLWTLVAVFLIESFEGPNEHRVSLDFEKDQNQLVIDLATELRQITPISPKWRYAIERRIEDERQLTMNAVGLGAQIRSGCFWNLSGTFLFTVYVMTALGFGAPVPHTIWGRALALVYAILAVPTHIYLMMNASTYVAIKVESYTRCLDRQISSRSTASGDTSANRETGKFSRSTEKAHKYICTRSFTVCIKVMLAGRCVPIAIFSYYVLGLVCFGVLRNKSSLESIMFPLEFTTTGGLALVDSYVRILYGLYIEGAMYVFACTVASVRRNTNITLEHLGEQYRLFEKNTDATQK